MWNESIPQLHPLQDCNSYADGCQAEEQWQVATYRGLTVGRSTNVDMTRVLGVPNWMGAPGDQLEDAAEPEVWYEYETAGEIKVS
jgi:hypothetical protein